jgi:hypothetical protein
MHEGKSRSSMWRTVAKNKKKKKLNVKVIMYWLENEY